MNKFQSNIHIGLPQQSDRVVPSFERSSQCSVQTLEKPSHVAARCVSSASSVPLTHRTGAFPCKVSL